MAFEGFDVEAQPERRADLTAFGVQRVPATIVGDRIVHGWNPQALAELVGVRYRAAKKLTPAELAQRMDVVLDATQRAMRQVPREHLGMGDCPGVNVTGSLPMPVIVGLPVYLWTP